MLFKVGWGHLRSAPVVEAHAVRKAGEPLDREGMVYITIPKLVRHGDPVRIQIPQVELATILDMAEEE